MPDFPTDQTPATGAPRVQIRNFTMNFSCVGNDDASVQISDIGPDVAGAEIATMRAGLGALSNGAVYETTFSEKLKVSKGRVNPLDEAHSSANMKLILVFEDANLNTKEIGVPAPDASYFGLDGISITTPDGAAAAGTPARLLFDAIAGVIAVLNGGAAAATQGTWRFLRGYRSAQSRKLPKPRGTSSVAVEPSATTEPGPESSPN